MKAMGTKMVMMRMKMRRRAGRKYEYDEYFVVVFVIVANDHDDDDWDDDDDDDDDSDHCLSWHKLRVYVQITNWWPNWRVVVLITKQALSIMITYERSHDKSTSGDTEQLTAEILISEAG